MNEWWWVVSYALECAAYGAMFMAAALFLIDPDRAVDDTFVLHNKVKLALLFSITFAVLALVAR